MADLTHAGLCAIAVRWLKRAPSAGGPGCTIAVSEPRAEARGECPDAIGFRAGHLDGSVLVECKVSRADFLADKAKPHRQPGCGMGTWRYYMAPAGMLRPEELPERWGLLEVNSRGHVKPLAGPAVAAAHWGQYAEALEAYRHQQVDVERERALLVRLLARLSDPEALNLRVREVYAANSRMARTIDKLREELSQARMAAFAQRAIEDEQMQEDVEA